MWEEATKWESEWHGNCVNTYGEQEKQLLYASRMGLQRHHDGRSPYNFNPKCHSVIDIGSGPTSLLLKCVGLTSSVAVDPICFPQWVQDRYKVAGIEFVQSKGEDLLEDDDFMFCADFDEAWIYNVLQHTENPEKVIRNAQIIARVIRIFEWIDTPTNVGHIHTLTETDLNNWLYGYGKVEQIAECNCFGKAYYGIFPTP